MSVLLHLKFVATMRPFFFFLFTCLFNKYLGQARITFFQMPISFRDVLPSLLNFHGFTKAFFLQKSIFEWLTWYWKLLGLQQVLTSNICIFSSLSMWKHTPNQRNSSWFEALVLHIAERKELADQQQADKTREYLPVGPESFWKSKCRSCPSYLHFQIPAATIHEDDRNVVYTTWYGLTSNFKSYPVLHRYKSSKDETMQHNQD